MAIGFRFWSGEKFGEAPTWSASARYIQVDATPTRIGLHVPAEVAMVGDAKLVLRQLSDAARANDWKRLGQSDWLQEVADVRINFDRVIVEQQHKHHDDTPIHPARVARELCEVIDPDATIVIDSFTMSGWMSQRFNTYRERERVTRNRLRDIAEQFGNWVKNRSQKWGAPILEAPEGRRDDFVDRYFRGAKADELVVILKAREPARIMIAIGTQECWHLQLAQRWIIQYNFYINDQRWGRMFVRMSPYLPFSARVCLNQHHWLANRMREEGIDFRQ